MTQHNLFRIFAIIVLCISLSIQPFTAQEEEQDMDLPETSDETPEQEETLEVLETVWAEETSIASRVTTTVEEAPAIVTVITAKQIRDMGARTLNDVLKIVPGFDAMPYCLWGAPCESFFGRLFEECL